MNCGARAATVTVSWWTCNRCHVYVRLLPRDLNWRSIGVHGLEKGKREIAGKRSLETLCWPELHWPGWIVVCVTRCEVRTDRLRLTLNQSLIALLVERHFSSVVTLYSQSWLCFETPFSFSLLRELSFFHSSPQPTTVASSTAAVRLRFPYRFERESIINNIYLAVTPR